MLNSLIHPLRPASSLAEQSSAFQQKKGNSLSPESGFSHAAFTLSLCICTIKFTAFAGAGISGRKGQTLLIFPPPPPTETSNPPCTRLCVRNSVQRSSDSRSQIAVIICSLSRSLSWNLLARLVEISARSSSLFFMGMQRK